MNTAITFDNVSISPLKKENFNESDFSSDYYETDNYETDDISTLVNHK